MTAPAPPSRWSRMVEALRRVNAPPPTEESIPLRVAVFGAVMASVAPMAATSVGGTWLSAAVLGGVPLGHWSSYLNRHRPGYGRKAALAAGATVAFVRFLSVVLGGPGALGMRVALAELFLWIQLLHAFDLTSRRDLMFTLLSSFSLVLVGGGLLASPDPSEPLPPGFSVAMALWGVAALASLVLAHRSQMAEVPDLPAVGPPQRAPRALITVSATVVVVGLTTAVTFQLIPPADPSRFGGLPARIGNAAPVPDPGGLSNPTLAPGGRRTTFGYFGYARFMDLAARGRPDSTPVMQVRAARPDFWRGQSFDIWDGRYWSMSTEAARPVTGPGAFDIEPPPEELLVQYLGKPFVQTYYLQRPTPNLVFGAYKADQVYGPFQSVGVLADGTIRAGVQPGAGTVYTVVSRRPMVTEQALREVDSEPPNPRNLLPADVHRLYTQLPSSLPARVRDLAARVTAGSPTVYDKVRALERWLSANTTYDLDAPPLRPGADAVDQFLFVDRKGFCEQIGSALVVMLRSLGIPARLTVGYTPGQRDPFRGLWQVRAKDAHAWAEVWFPGLGWQAFDPTASVPLSGESARPEGSSLSSRLADALRALPAWLPALAVAGLALAGTGMAIRLTLARRRRLRNRPWALRTLERLERLGRRRGRPRTDQETPREYVDALVSDGLAVSELAEAVPVLEAALFSGEPVAEEARRTADELVGTALRAPRAESRQEAREATTP